jgi:hypothetical protein
MLSILTDALADMGRYLALKVLMSKHSSEADTELAICRKLTEAAASDPFKSKKCHDAPG